MANFTILKKFSNSVENPETTNISFWETMSIEEFTE